MPTTSHRALADRRPIRTTAGDDLVPFHSLESAQEYIGLLGTAVDDALTDIHEDIDAAGKDNVARRLEALHLVNYKLGQLQNHVHATGLLLNDLRTLRRLLLGERSLNGEKRP